MSEYQPLSDKECRVNALLGQLALLLHEKYVRGAPAEKVLRILAIGASVAYALEQEHKQPVERFIGDVTGKHFDLVQEMKDMSELLGEASDKLLEEVREAHKLSFDPQSRENLPADASAFDSWLVSG